HRVSISFAKCTPSDAELQTTPPATRHLRCLLFCGGFFIFRLNLNSPPMDQTSAREVLKKYLEEKKLRPTRERFALLDEILKMSGHFDADQLFATLARKGVKASRATVYNTLD